MHAGPGPVAGLDGGTHLDNAVIARVDAIQDVELVVMPAFVGLLDTVGHLVAKHGQDLLRRPLHMAEEPRALPVHVQLEIRLFQRD